MGIFTKITQPIELLSILIILSGRLADSIQCVYGSGTVGRGCAG
jgi:hypothetical protein